MAEREAIGVLRVPDRRNDRWTSERARGMIDGRARARTDVGEGLTMDEARFGVPDWPAMLADLPAFVGALLDAHHRPVPELVDLEEFCAGCGTVIAAPGGTRRHAPEDASAAFAWLEGATAEEAS
jgi:hypothetical protein